MPTITIKQVDFPLIDTSQPPPPFPDPYQFVFFGGDSSGNLVIWNYLTLTWDVPTQQEINDNVPNYITSNSENFFSKTDSSGNLIDFRFLNKEILKIERSSIDFYETESFTKPTDSDTITMNPPNTLLPNTQYLITK